MLDTKTYKRGENFAEFIMMKLTDYSELIKLKLNLLVVTTSLFAYLMTASGVRLIDIVVLLFGGLMISGSSGAINEILETSSDAQMKRTEKRPLPAGRMTSIEAWVVSLALLIVGLSMLYVVFNALTFYMSLLVVVLYAFVYTPLKKKSPIAVLVGAIPGALPPVIGVAAATGQIGGLAIFLFILQFLWQFPHFWSVAYMAQDDYKKAGFKMIPNNRSGSRFIAIQCVVYAASLILLSSFTLMYQIGTWLSFLGLGICGLVFTLYAIGFFKSFDYASARKLMFASIIYLPIVYLVLLIDFLISR